MSRSGVSELYNLCDAVRCVNECMVCVSVISELYNLGDVVRYVKNWCVLVRCVKNWSVF